MCTHPSATHWEKILATPLQYVRPYYMNKSLNSDNEYAIVKFYKSIHSAKKKITNSILDHIF